MNLSETVLGNQNSGLMSALSKNAGIDEGAVQAIVGQLLPALSRGIKQNATDSGGLGSLVGALEKGNHRRYLDRPETLNEQSSIDEGNAILGHIFGSKDISRNVAGHAASATGSEIGIVKQLLPLVASVAMGALSKQTADTGITGSTLSNNSGETSPAFSTIASFLDADNDGEITDDLLRLAKRFF